jgi:hypothetical protein
MAQRRMFSVKIVDSDAFLEMPQSSQLLYFHLGMHADDDGFVNPKKIMRVIGSVEDDLKILFAKRFLLPFENGVVVIKHWLINNLIRKDFYQQTLYVEQKKRLTIKENKAYTECKQIVNNLDTQYSIGKDRLGKDILQPDGCDINPLLNEFLGINPTINFGNITQRDVLKDLVKKFGYDKTLNTIKYAVSVQGKKYAPVITTPHQLKNKLGELIEIGRAHV